MSVKCGLSLVQLSWRTLSRIRRLGTERRDDTCDQTRRHPCLQLCSPFTRSRTHRSVLDVSNPPRQQLCRPEINCQPRGVYTMVSDASCRHYLPTTAPELLCKYWGTGKLHHSNRYFCVQKFCSKSFFLSLRCRAISNDVGDNVLPEFPVPSGPDELILGSHYLWINHFTHHKLITYLTDWSDDYSLFKL